MIGRFVLRLLKPNSHKRLIAWFNEAKKLVLCCYYGLVYEQWVVICSIVIRETSMPNKWIFLEGNT